MIKLKLLGRAALESEAGPIAQRALQRRRVALLALLAVARKPVSREKVTAYLWPESDSEQARHLLSVAVYELRKAIHDDVIVSARDEVELNAQHLSTDVAEFEAAIAAGDAARAVELYGGPFMDGFHINDAPDFERWMDAERDRFARSYATTLEKLAQQYTSEGNHNAAVATLRKLAAHDPYSGRYACMLMLALEAVGDRAGALQHARTHATMLKEEFGADPDPDVEALCERLRRDPREVKMTFEPGEYHRHVQIDAQPWQKRSVIIPAAVTAVITVVLLVAFVYWRMTRVPPAGAETAPNTIAVLPFNNLTPTDSNTFFSDGLSEEIINALSSVPSLDVVARTSSFAFRGKSIGEVRDSLKADYVLEGSVRRGGDRLRVIARLVNTETGLNVWDEDWDRPYAMENQLFIQEEIARSVVNGVGAKLTAAPTARLTAQLPRNPEAFDLFVEGREYLHRRTIPDMQRALDRFNRAIAHDSTYALAYALRGEALALLGAYDYGALRPADAYPAARASAERALQLDPTLAEAHTTLAAILFNYDRDWAAAEKAFLRAIEINHGYSTAHHWYSLLLNAQQRHAEASKEIMRAREVDPGALVTATGLARNYYFSRNFDKATYEYQRAIKADSTFVTAHIGLGVTYAALGRYAEAVSEFNKVPAILGMTPPVVHALRAYASGRGGDKAAAEKDRRATLAMAARIYVPNEIVAMAHIGAGDHAAAINALEQAAQLRSGGVNYLAVDPLVDPLRSDPRFNALVNRVRPQKR